MFTPWTGEKVEVQVTPASIEYSTVAPGSKPVIVKEPSLVIRSVGETPVSLVSDTPRAAGAVVSSVNVKGAEAGPTLPATSV